MARGRWLVFGLLGVAGLLALSVEPVAKTSLPGEPLLRRAFASAPPIEGRLTGDLQGPPGKAVRREPPASFSRASGAPAVRGSDRIERRALERPGAAELHSLALLSLSEGRLDRAILTLEAVTAREPTNAEALSDLAAALLTRAREADRPLDLAAAFAAGDAAVALAPSLPTALFNRATALTRLHIRGRATAAWEDYLDADRDPGSPWAAEAREHLQALREPTTGELWTDQIPVLETAASRGDRETVRSIVTRFPQFARLHLEEKVLPAWADAAARGDSTAEAHLALARLGAAALEQAAHDTLLRESVVLLDQTRRAGDARRLDLLVRGHRAYGEGMRLYRDTRDHPAARPRLGEAARLLREAGSPFAGWADFYGAVCDHYAGSSYVRGDLLALRERTDAARHPVLAGLTEWMLGTIENNLNHPEAALARFRAADDLLSRSVGLQASGFVNVLLAEAYDKLGETSAAWSSRLAALEWVFSLGERQRAHSTLHNAASALLQSEDLSLALEIVQELLDNDRALGQPGALAEAHLLEARILDRLGRTAEALESLRTARNRLAEMEESDQKSRILAQIDLIEGEALAETDPARAVEILTASLESNRSREFHFRDIEILTARARALEALGNLSPAEADLRSALDEHERGRREIRDQQRRASYFETAQPAFDQMIRLRAVRREDPAAAFDAAEQARARLLLDLTTGEDDLRLPRPLTAAEVRPQLPRGVALVEYAILPDRLLAWVVTRESLKMEAIPVAEPDLARAVRALRTTVERGAGEKEVRLASAPLFDLLVRPLLPHLPEGTALVFVPDRFLVHVPFPALFDSARKRYLLEDRLLGTAPSASFYLASLAAVRRFGPDGTWTVLAVGDPAFDTRLHPQARLPEAAAEVTDLEALYPGAHVLRDESATRTAFLETAGRYRLIHYAGHAIADPAVPHLSRLLLAPGPGDALGDLTAQEIAGLRLDATELVVLSACRTLTGGTGRESLTGLAAAFLAAGPPVVVSSLWNAEDRATRELMRTFHHALRQGQPPGPALRTAQLELLHHSDETLRSPSAWAGFAAVGGGVGG